MGDIVKKYFVSIFVMMAFVFGAEAAIKVKNQTANRYEAQMELDEDGEFVDGEDAIATLENDIRILDEEIAKCKKQKKGWIAATVIGAAGTVATGTAAAVQGVKLKDRKDEYNEEAQKLYDIDKELNLQEAKLEDAKKKSK